MPRKNTSSTPLISVVIPCYKHAEYIARALRSVEEQTYPNIELIIIDDASPDKSVEEIKNTIESKSFKKRFNHQVYFFPHQENRGAHTRINEGLSRATGDYLTILNSDDVFHKERFTRMIHAMQESASRFAFSRVGYVFSNNQPDAALSEETLKFSRMQDNIPYFPSVGFAMLVSQCGISTGNFVFTRKLLEKIGPFNDLKYCHDWDFALRALAETEPLFVEDSLYFYRLHQSNSFRSLHNMAEQETAQVLTGYFTAILTGQVANPLAPSPKHWPSVFELFLEEYGFTRHFQTAQQHYYRTAA